MPHPEPDRDRPSPDGHGWPLTPLQQACVARSLLSPGGGYYVQQWVCDWTAPLRLDRWRQAWEAVARRHDALRACFKWDPSGELRQHFVDRIDVAMDVRNPGAGTTARAPVLSAFLRADRSDGFRLATAPLWRLTVLAWSEREATTIWTFHHALLDGRSHVQVWREAIALYEALIAGRDPLLPAARPFREFVHWLATTPTAAAEAYWRDRLDGAPEATDLPTLSLVRDPGDDEDPPAVEILSLGPDDSARIREAAQRHGVTLNNLIQGAWALVLARYQAVEDIVFGVTRSGRHWTGDHPDDLVGMFINTVPFRVDASPNQPVGPWLRGLRAQQLATRAGEHASAEQIRAWCGRPRSTVLFRTAVMFEHHDAADLLDTPTRRVRLHEKTDLPTLAAYAGTVLTLTLGHSPRHHPAAQARSILRHVHVLLEAFAGATDGRILADLPLMPSADREAVLTTWQGPVTAPAPPLHRVLEDQAARTPDAPAVEFLGRTLTYAELHARSNRLARRLRQFCAPGDRVAVILDRATDQPVAWLAILKAGLVYAPLEAANPRERLAFHLADLRPALLLTQVGLLSLVPAGRLRVLCLDETSERAAQAALDGGPLGLEAEAAAAADLLYTSGSGGAPKAAINHRGGLDNFALELRRTFDFAPGDRILQSSATSFDASLFDFVAALQSGASLVVVPSAQLRPGPALARTLEEQRISVVLLTPTVMRSTSVPSAPAVRVLISAGEPLTADLLARWSPGRRVFNVCGPTECSVWYTCEESRPDGNRPTIGRLVANCRGYVLDEARRPVAVGVPGEFYLGGAGVGLGYWNRPELTRDHYLPDPFAPGGGALMYRTGDRVRWLADGRIEYLGRLDFQVKVQGVRVELGEIETALRGHPGVADAALVLHEDRLLAWFVPRDAGPSDEALRGWLADRIPQVFVPAGFHEVPEFPRTRTGKTDRAALLAMWHAARKPTDGPSARRLGVAEMQMVLKEWNRTDRPYPLGRTVVDLFLDQVRERPDAPALRSGPHVLSYAVVNRRAGAIARRLLQAGLQPEDLVVLRFERSVAGAVSALGVLMAGGAFVPLDADIPVARQESILRDSAARFALMAPGFIGTLGDWTGWSAGIADHQGEDDPPSAAARAVEAEVRCRPRHRAYVIYTSGSTGAPKGVEIEHRALTNLVCFYHERLGLTAEDRSTLLAQPAFDASIADLWPVWCAGGTVLVPERWLLTEPDELITWLAETGATFSFVPTALGELLFHRPWPAATRLRFLCVGGEALQVHPPPGLPFTVLNTYGPTENTVDATWEVLAPSAPDHGAPTARPSIGSPIANVRAYVLDDALQPVAVDVEGELFLGGVQVARGYLWRPELTRDRFLPDPFADAPGSRMYRTGDRVRWRSTGRLDFLGRVDDQIQVRGQRVELGEIEALLRTHPAVRQVCCRPLADPGGRDAEGLVRSLDAIRGVVAHVVAPGLGDPELSSELRRFLEARVPAYMVPGIFLDHRNLPLTPQGKVDRGALDATVSARQRPGSAVVPPPHEDGLQRLLADLWRRLLPHDDGMRADRTFQALGGDSLQSVKLLLGVEEITGRRLALSTFLSEPTFAGLCRAVARAEDESRTPVLALRRGGTRPPVFCLYDVHGDVAKYFALAAALGDDRPVWGIRSPALVDIGRVPASMEAAAVQVRATLRKVWPAGPFAVIGFSWAGLLAFEVARQCVHEEGSNPFCGLLGTQAPPRRPSAALRLGHALRWFPHWCGQFLRDRGHRWKRLRRAARFARHLGGNLVAGEEIAIPDWATTDLTRALIALAHRYRPAVARPVQMHLFRERDSFRSHSHPASFTSTDHHEDAGWSRWAGCPPVVHWLEGDHLSVLRPPHVDRLAEELRAALAAHFVSCQPEEDPQQGVNRQR